LEDIHAVFDTPEDSYHQLNRENVTYVDSIFYTHWHPDHTMGMRVIEQMTMHFLAWFLEGKEPTKKINICALSEVLRDIKDIKNRYSSYLEYYESDGLVSLVGLEAETPFTVGDIEIIPLPVVQSTFMSTVYIIMSKGKKVGYAPCDSKPFPVHGLLEDLDVLFIGDVVPEGKLKDGYTILEGNMLRDEVYMMDELLEIITTYAIKKTIVVHIEEEWGRSFDDYKGIEEQYKRFNIEFAFDGMRVEV
jgi:phosphoribosyl 1,2-cyclic phosphate phosphodiesterase